MTEKFEYIHELKGYNLMRQRQGRGRCLSRNGKE